MLQALLSRSLPVQLMTSMFPAYSSSSTAPISVLKLPRRLTLSHGTARPWPMARTQLQPSHEMLMGTRQQVRA